MTSDQYGKLAPAALINMTQLRDAARVLYRHGYFPSAVALAVIADEEMAKAILFLVAGSEPSRLPGLDWVLRNHRAKQALVAWFARVADAMGPALRVFMREVSKSRKGKARGDTDQPDLQPLYDEFFKVFSARGRRRQTDVEKQAVLAVGDIQATKNNCLYVGLDEDGVLSAPQRVANRKLAKAYLASLDNRLLFINHMIVGNVKNGRLHPDIRGEVIERSWRLFLSQIRRSRNQKSSETPH